MVVVEREDPPQPLGSCCRRARIVTVPSGDCRANAGSGRPSTSSRAVMTPSRNDLVRRSTAATRAQREYGPAGRRPRSRGQPRARGFGRSASTPSPSPGAGSARRLLLAPLLTEERAPRHGTCLAGVAPAALTARAGRRRGGTPRPPPVCRPARASPLGEGVNGGPWSTPLSSPNERECLAARSTAASAVCPRSAATRERPSCIPMVLRSGRRAEEALGLVEVRRSCLRVVARS